MTDISDPKSIYAIRDAEDATVYHLPVIQRETGPFGTVVDHSLRPMCDTDVNTTYRPIPRDDPPDGTRMCGRCQRFAELAEHFEYGV